MLDTGKTTSGLCSKRSGLSEPPQGVVLTRLTGADGRVLLMTLVMAVACEVSHCWNRDTRDGRAHEQRTARGGG